MTRRRIVLAAALCALAAPAAAPAQERPRISAPAAILVEPATGDIVFSRNADQRRAIASTTKLMTALVTLEEASLDDVMTTVPYAALPVESLGGFRAGERVTVRDLLRALLVASANDAAATLAVRVSGSREAFVRQMNRRAREIGLRNTRFANPIGLDAPGNYSSATDLAKLTLLLRRYAFFRETTDLERVTVRSGGRTRTLSNRNLLIRRVPFVNGVKTGRTQQAGWVLVGSGTRRGVTVVSAVLGTASEAARQADTLALLRYGTDRYRIRTAVSRGQVMARAALEHRDETVDLVASRTVRRTVRRDERLTTRVLGAPETLDGPLPQGARVGTIEVRMRGKVVERVALLTAREVDAATVLQRLQTFLSKTSTLLLLAAFAACSLYLVLLRRRLVRRRGQARGAPA